MTELIFLSGNVPSSKNSKQWTGKYLLSSNLVHRYLKNFEWQWRIIPPEFSLLELKDYPITVGFHVVRDSRRRWDFINMMQLCADLMVKHKWIPDDNMNYFIPECLWIDGKHFSYSKENPGVYIKILKHE